MQCYDVSRVNLEGLHVYRRKFIIPIKMLRSVQSFSNITETSVFALDSNSFLESTLVSQGCYGSSQAKISGRDINASMLICRRISYHAGSTISWVVMGGWEVMGVRWWHDDGMYNFLNKEKYWCKSVFLIILCKGKDFSDRMAVGPLLTELICDI